MRIALDITSLIGPRTGVGVFTAELAAGLAEDPDLDLVTFAATWRGRGEAVAATPAKARAVRLPMAARPLRALWRRMPVPPIEAWTGSVDVVHGPNYVVPPARKAAMVASVHDLTVLHYPEMCTPATLAYPDLIRKALQRGAWIHVDTDSVGAEVIEAFGAPPERVVTVRLAPEPVPETDPSEGRTLAGYERYILALGTVEPRKDLPGLVAAFDELAGEMPDVALVIAGPEGWGDKGLDAAVAETTHWDRIVRLGWVDDRARAGLLRGASVLAYPSRYEGFGLPPLEAMSVGVPVVATKVGAVAETCGDAAELVPPADPDALAAALGEVLDKRDTAARLVAAGEANVERFGWQRSVAEMVDLYRKARLT